MGRGLNVMIAVILLVLSSPLWLVIATLIWLESGRPVLYVQARAGLNGEVFRIYKFRTMVINAERQGLGLNVEPEDERITRTGRFLRRWSLDELPQILNVLRGEMNLVGPRPALPFQAAKYSPRQRRRLLVPPGITGWAQVNGRNALTWEQRIKADLWYVENRTILLDLRILLRTLRVVFDSQELYELNAGLDDELNVAEPPSIDPEGR